MRVKEIASPVARTARYTGLLAVSHSLKAMEGSWPEHCTASAVALVEPGLFHPSSSQLIKRTARTHEQWRQDRQLLLQGLRSLVQRSFPLSSLLRRIHRKRRKKKRSWKIPGSYCAWGCSLTGPETTLRTFSLGRNAKPANWATARKISAPCWRAARTSSAIRSAAMGDSRRILRGYIASIGTTPTDQTPLLRVFSPFQSMRPE